jgi:phage terminase large subunit
MGRIRLKATPIYLRNAKAQTEIVVNRGGSGSSKSHSIMQLLVSKVIENSGLRIQMLRKVRSTIHNSLYFMFNKIIQEFDVDSLGIKYNINKARYDVEFSNGSLIHFDGLDDAEKKKSTEWNIIWFEEANELSFADYQTTSLYIRSPLINGLKNQIFISFNPIDQDSWLKTKLIDVETDLTEIVSTYKDNPFYDKASRKRLEKLINIDKIFYQVYCLGQWGVLKGLIYKNWETVDSIPENYDEVIYGLDFGFNEPSALIKIYLKDGVPYLEEKIYRTELTNLQLMELMLEVGVKPNDIIYADCAEPARIKEMSSYWKDSAGNEHRGFNVKAADKSVSDGIDFVKRFALKIIKGSINLLNEIRAYKWKERRDGEILDEPVKMFDHLMDAARYALYTHLFDPAGAPEIIFID